MMLQAVVETASLLFPRLLQLSDDSGEEEPAGDPQLSISGSPRAICLDHFQDKITYTAWLSVYLLKLDGRVTDLSDRSLTDRSGLTHPDQDFFMTTFHGFAMSLKPTDKLSLLLYLENMAFRDFAFSGECCILLLRALIFSDESELSQST
jgi:hypothetical protein